MRSNIFNNLKGITYESRRSLVKLLLDILNNSNYTNLIFEKNNQQRDKDFIDNFSFWKEALSNKLYINQCVKFENVSLSEWLPQSPGLFHTEEAIMSRMEAEHYIDRKNRHFGGIPSRRIIKGLRSINENYEIINELLPDGKLSMIRGGVGCVRLEPKQIKNQDVIILGMTTSNTIHEGIPLICNSTLYDRIIELLKMPKSPLFSVVGKIVIMPKEVSLINYKDSIPRYCVWAEEISPLRQTKNENLELSISISFLNEYKDILYSFVTLEEKNNSQFGWGIDWLKEYAIKYSSSTPTIVGDFDELTSHFSDSKVLFPIKEIAKGKYNKTELEFFNKLTGEEFKIMAVENKEINVSGGQVGFIGDNNRVEQTLNQQNNLSQSIDFDKLLTALSQLISALDAKQNKTAEERIAIGEVAQAEKAAQEKDESGVVKHLKSAGTWVLDTAKDIGVDIVTDLIKKQAGL